MRAIQFRKFKRVSMQGAARPKAAPLSNEAIVKKLKRHWSDECRAFVAHWASLRAQDSLLPSSEKFLDIPSPRFSPNIYVVELIEGAAIVRFQGFELVYRWGMQMTGLDIHVNQPSKVRARAITNMTNVVQQPCGYLAMNAYMTSAGREITADLVQLPLAVGEGRPPRLVCFADGSPNLMRFERLAHFSRTIQLGWLDLGAGMPVSAPLDLLK